MKKALLVLGMLFVMLSAMVLIANAKASAAISSIVIEKYIGASGAVCYDKPVIQTNVWVGWKSGFYVDLWNSSPFKGFNEVYNYGTEADYCIGFSHSLFKSKTIVDVYLSFCDEPSLGKVNGEDLFYNYLKLSRSTKNMMFWLQYDNVAFTAASSYNGANRFCIGASATKKLSKLGVTAWVSPVLDTGHGVFLKGEVKAEWSLTKKFSIVLPGVKWFVPVQLNDGRIFEKAFYTGFNYSL